jgi:hypothetical protein
MEAWETEKQRYEMVDVGDGNVAYILKDQRIDEFERQ